MIPIEVGPPVSIDEIRSAERDLGVQLPSDYVAFMQRSNGGEWEMGDKWCLMLWPIESLRMNNDDLEIDQYVPGVVIFGTNGGTEYFSFNFGTSPPSFVTIPAAFDPEYVAPIARTFAGFLQALEQGWEVGDSPSPD